VVPTSALLLSELEAIDGCPPERWAEILHRITKLFFGQADSLAAEQIALFDDIFMRLMDRVDTRSLAQLSLRLSEAKCTLPQSARRLAFDDNEAVLIPILKSGRLAPDLILDVARSRGPKHRLAIAGRLMVDPSLSEVLVGFGEQAVCHALAENLGASLTEAGWARLVQLCESDKRLAEMLKRRSDVPPPLKRKVLAMLEDARMRSLQAMPRAMRDQIAHTIAAADAKEKPGNSVSADYAAAQASMVELGRKGKLNDSTVNRFAVRGEYTNVVAALAFLTGSPIEMILPLIASDDIDGLVLACKASRLDWATASSIVKNRPGLPPISAAELEKAKKTFETFSLSTAQWTVRF
jgi:uncharacterized protein (DUF2336 family)